MVEQDAEAASRTGSEVRHHLGEIVHAVESLYDHPDLAQIIPPHLLDQLGVVDALHQDAARARDPWGADR